MFSFASLGKLPLESATDTSITDGSAYSFFITVCSFSTSSLVTLSEDFTSSTTFSRLISDLFFLHLLLGHIIRGFHLFHHLFQADIRFVLSPPPPWSHYPRISPLPPPFPG